MTARRFILLAALLTLCALAFIGGCACVALMDDAQCDEWTDTMVQRWEGCR